MYIHAYIRNNYLYMLHYMYGKMCIEGAFLKLSIHENGDKHLLWLQLPFYCEMMTWMQRQSGSMGYHAIPEISTLHLQNLSKMYRFKLDLAMTLPQQKNISKLRIS